MKNFILIGCLIGGIFAFPDDLGHVAPTYSLAMDSSSVESEAPAKSANKIVTASMPPSTVIEVTYAKAEASASEVEKPSFKLQSVNGVSLYDDPTIVVKKLGEPMKITKDPYLKELMTYHYPNMDVVFSDDMIYSVELAEGTKTLDIDGVKIAATIESVREALGGPDYITEDGIVFERGDALLKLFIDADTGKLTSIHYFDSFSM
ncbi:hypothetical protein [Paenibacillus sp. LHD-38]|uniref:hypothetical protein n=1 Tax=Paenibacillus sp. LHD-38 TaxID=3072143 RepID=UPI00280EB03D|nr:hypothetical protein [Paenibacillus sp. LHD-38]MDQ8732914.1 hypothetical protein [Paenibacillus sp. LHD-38]